MDNGFQILELSGALEKEVSKVQETIIKRFQTVRTGGCHLSAHKMIDVGADSSNYELEIFLSY